MKHVGESMWYVVNYAEFYFFSIPLETNKLCGNSLSVTDPSLIHSLLLCLYNQGIGSGDSEELLAICLCDIIIIKMWWLGHNQAMKQMQLKYGLGEQSDKRPMDSALLFHLGNKQSLTLTH